MYLNPTPLTLSLSKGRPYFFFDQNQDEGKTALRQAQGERG
jgi:hypothetical protein